MTLLKDSVYIKGCRFQHYNFSFFPPFQSDHRLKYFEAGTGPIYLSQLNCDGSEATLLDCETFTRATGIHTCDHMDDVGVHCQGNISSGGSTPAIHSGHGRTNVFGCLLTMKYQAPSKF